MSETREGKMEKGNLGESVDRQFFYISQIPQHASESRAPVAEQPTATPPPHVSANRRCDICNKVFSTPGNCSIHKKKHMSDTPKVQCDICLKEFSTPGNLSIHKRIHTGDKSLSCDVCDKKFLHSGNLTIHKRKVNREGADPRLGGVRSLRRRTENDLIVFFVLSFETPSIQAKNP